MSDKKAPTDWRWPQTGQDPEILGKQIMNINSPYQEEKPPQCYPGTPLSRSLLGRATGLLAKQINSIGSHTHVEIGIDGEFKFRPGEGGFEVVQRMEAQAIWMLASVLGGKPGYIDGYFCGGGTEANIEGLWVGREWLRRTPDPLGRGTVVVTTPLLHYSISKGVEMLDLGHHEWLRCTECGLDHLFMPEKSGSGLNFVGMNERGEMDLDCLEEFFRRKYSEGFRRFLLAPTVGTSVMGSIDPIAKIGEFIRKQRRQTDANFYLHVDASFAGFTVPFVAPQEKIAFQVPEVMSVTVDGDKMGSLPYPAGIFLCRNDLMQGVARKVNYVRGHEDDTISGSRSALAPVLAWYLFQVNGISGQRDYVEQCLSVRDYLLERIKHFHTEFAGLIRVLPHSPWVNFAPMEINLSGQRGIPEFIKEVRDPQKELAVPEKFKRDPALEAAYRSLEAQLAPYHLRADNVLSEPTYTQSCPRNVFKICIMPHHTKEHIDQFLADLLKVEKTWLKLHL